MGSDDGNMYALSESDGSAVWRYSLGDRVRSTPAIDTEENSLFAGCDDGNVTSLDTRTGTLKWSFKTGGAVRSAPAIFENMVAVGSDDGTLHILNKYTGKEEWSYSPGYYLFSSPASSSPVVYGKTIYFATENGYIYALDSKKKEGPTSPFAYYVAVIIIAIIGAGAVIRRVARK